MEVPVRSASWLVVLALASGCSSSPKADEGQGPPARAPAPAKPRVTAPPAPPPEEAPPDDSPIVIKKKPEPSASASSGSLSADPGREAKIAELRERARASQGKDNGQPYREASAPPPAAGGRRAAVKQRLADIDREAASLKEERAAMVHKQAGRQGRYRVTREVSDDPERTAAIDARMKELDAEAGELRKELAALDAAEKAKGGASPRQP